MRFFRMIVVGLLLAALTGCGSRGMAASFENTVQNTSEYMVPSASSDATQQTGTFYYKCYKEQGYYYVDKNHVCFVEYDSGERFVACSRPNCKHKDEKCSAWLDGAYSYVGVAEYKGRLYYMAHDPNKNMFYLITSDLAGEGKKTIVTINGGDRKEDGWCMSHMCFVYYCGDIAWCTTDYEYYENNKHVGACNKLEGYRLDSGEKISLTDLRVQTGDAVTDPFSFRSIHEDLVVAYDYDDASIITYDIATGDRQSVTQEQLVAQVKKIIPEAGDYQKILVRSMGSLYHSDCISFQTYLYSDENKEDADRNVIFTWNLREDPVLLKDFERGGLLFMVEGGIQSTILKDNCCFVAEDLNDEMSQIGYLNLVSGQYEKLFEYNTRSIFRILYEGSDYFIGTIDEGDCLCKVKKSDFMDGNFANVQVISHL